MNITANALTKAAAAAAAAAVAGAIFIAGQIKHPPSGTFTTETTQWVVRSCAKSVMAALALAGITGIYLRALIPSPEYITARARIQTIPPD